MRRLTRLALLGGGLLAAAGWRALDGGATPSPGEVEADRRSRDMAFYAGRARRDPRGAADRAQLAGLILQWARETGDPATYRGAEHVARRSLALRTDHNAKAYLTLASSLLAQHRFPAALEAARRLNELAPAEPGARALLGEIQLELGDYGAARQTFVSLASARRNLAVAPRLARWAEIRGRTPEAGHILRKALAEAVTRRDLAGEQVAWFYLRVGDFEMRHGRLGEAEWALRAGLDVRPDDPRLLGALARVEALRQRWPHAIAYGERAGAGADIATLAIVGDGYAALGDSARAEAYYAAVERAAAERPEPYNRQWTLFRLEHGRRVSETLAVLSAEIAVRRDVYGYDQLAWALHLVGDHAAARAAMTHALRMGTRDAVLFFHAGMIERSLGNRQAAQRYLRAALAINPVFHPTYPVLARAALNDSPSPPLKSRKPLP